ncbi:MAG: hypothetical protein ACU88J_04060 [Gammaproteobacteria bacterium]
MNKLGIIAMIFTLSGCATIFDGSSQFLTVVPSNAKTDNTTCTAQNEEGQWKLIPSQSVSIHRDGNEMIVNCENAIQKGSVKVSPEFNGNYIFLDILTDFCTISCLIDGGTNSWYEYPPSIAVPMSNVKADLDKRASKVLPNHHASALQRVEEKGGVSWKDPVQPDLSGTTDRTPYHNTPNNALPDVKPDLSAATAGEQQAIEHACDTAREAMARQFYYECLSHELAKLGYR